MTTRFSIGVFGDDPDRAGKLFSLILKEITVIASPVYSKYITNDNKTVQNFEVVTSQSEDTVMGIFDNKEYWGTFDMLGIETMPSVWSSVAQIKRNGDSLVVRVTDGCRTLGIEQGDTVQVTMKAV